MKKFVIFAFVLVLASSSVWAFQGWDIFGKKSSTESEVVLEATDLQTSVKETKEAIVEVQADLQEQLIQNEAVLSENEQVETSNPLKSVVESYSDSTRLSKKKVEELMAKLGDVSDDIDLLIADNEAKDYELNRIHPFANFGAVIGFRNHEEKILPSIGAVANMGVKFANGLQVGTGVQYMICDFGNDKKVDFSWDITRLSLTTTVGWEW